MGFFFLERRQELGNTEKAFAQDSVSAIR
jgi:hypothetical protein